MPVTMPISSPMRLPASILAASLAAANRAATPGGETVGAKVVKQIWQAKDGGANYTILACKIEGVEGESRIQTYTAMELSKGDNIKATGEWVSYKGERQFKAVAIQLSVPPGVKGVLDWLTKGAVQGVGKVGAQRMVDRLVEGVGQSVVTPESLKALEMTEAEACEMTEAFAERPPTQSVVDWLMRRASTVGGTRPDRVIEAVGRGVVNAMSDEDMLRSIGVKAAIAAAVVKSWTTNQGMAELLAYMFDVGLKDKQAAKIIEAHGMAARKIVETNPWKLMSIDGIGFPTCDLIAAKKRLDKYCDARMEAGTEYVMTDLIARKGHCGLPMEELVAAVSRALEVDHGSAQIGIDLFVDGNRGIEDTETGLVYARFLWDAEIDVAEAIVRLSEASGTCLARAEAETAIDVAEREMGIELDREGGQFEAAVMAMMHSVMVITGGPGVGKSVTQRVIAQAKANLDVKLGLAAPTGRAAKVLGEKTGKDASTIHRLLGWNPTEECFVHDKANRLKMDHLIVDEYSMVDINLAAAHLEAQKDDSGLLMVGDVDQLASVGPGQVLKDVIESGTVPVAHLTKVHRQAEGSGVAVAVQRIKAGLSPFHVDEILRGVRMIECQDRDIEKHVISLLRFEMPQMGFDPMRDVQVLSSMRKGDYGILRMNRSIKAVLNPFVASDASSCLLGERQYTINDRVMQVRNDRKKGVYNGEIGTVVRIELDFDRKGRSTPRVITDFAGMEAHYKPDECLDLELANACTIHKLQGAECPAVIFAVPEKHRDFLTRNLIYTGGSRSKSELIFVGSQATVEAALDVVDGARRHTGLARRLAAAMPRWRPEAPAHREDIEPELAFAP